MNIFLIYPQLGFPLSHSCGIGYIAAFLREHGHTVDYLQLHMQEDILALYQAIEEKKPGLIGFASTTCQFSHLKKIIRHIKSISHAFVVCGGLHPTLQPECIHEIPELDAIVRGEGEYPMYELAEALENKRQHYTIRNIWFRQNGNIVKNELRPLISDLDELPFPDRDPHDYQSVLDNTQGVHRMIFSRGCTFGCPYCSNRALQKLYQDKGKYFRSRSPQKAIEEIERDANLFKFKAIFFDDDTITLDQEWFFEFFRVYTERFHFPFCCNLRPGTITDRMAQLLKSAGADSVTIGIEHGNEVLREKLLKRNISNTIIEKTVGLCKRAGIKKVIAHIMIGLPTENVDLYLDTVRLCRALGVVPYKYIFQPYPGTELGNLCEQNHWMPRKEFFFERREAVIDYPGFCREHIQLCFDVFSKLVHYKSLPLDVPFVRTVDLFRFYRVLDLFLLPIPRMLYRYLRDIRSCRTQARHACE